MYLRNVTGRLGGLGINPELGLLEETYMTMRDEAIAWALRSVRREEERCARDPEYARKQAEEYTRSLRLSFEYSDLQDLEFASSMAGISEADQSLLLTRGFARAAIRNTTEPKLGKRRKRRRHRIVAARWRTLVRIARETLDWSYIK